jgi:hypothetical protein
VSLLHTTRAVDRDVCLILVRFCVPADQRNYWGSLLVTAGKLLAKTALATFSIIAILSCSPQFARDGNQLKVITGTYSFITTLIFILLLRRVKNL